MGWVGNDCEALALWLALQVPIPFAAGLPYLLHTNRELGLMLGGASLSRSSATASDAFPTSSFATFAGSSRTWRKDGSFGPITCRNRIG